jgi:hypothetical protein
VGYNADKCLHNSKSLKQPPTQYMTSVLDVCFEANIRKKCGELFTHGVALELYGVRYQCFRSCSGVQLRCS